jgi:hypothetical protein
MKYIIAMLLALSLIMGCSTEVIQEPQVDEIIYEEPEEIIAPTLKLTSDIEIVAGQLIPDTLTIPVDTETILYIHNTQNTTQRFEIALYGSEVSEDIAPNSYRMITIFPRNKGIVSMELNGARLGTITIS